MKIVIVGGGTAGWLAASVFAVSDIQRKNSGLDTKLDITVLESKDIPIIGAGEGSTGIFADYLSKKLKPLGITEIDFLNKTEATLKLGIRFKDWKHIGHEYQSPIQPTKTTMGNVDIDLMACHTFGKYQHASPAGYLMDNEYSCYSKNTGLIPLNGYHFDAHKVGKYFKEKCMEHGVKNIVGEINQLNIDNETGFLKSVNIKESTEKIEADFWIDASGFSKVLIGNMDGGWESYKEVLPTNAAIPYLYNHKKDEDVLAETLAWAQPNGWMWQIPTQERYGCGYVYSDNHTTYDKALEELIKNTGRDIEPIRNLKFEAGRVKKFWSKNVLAVGLSCGFLEPLQATSIHSTLIQLDLFAYHYFNSDLDKIDFKTSPQAYNNTIGKMWDDFRDLLQIHYVTQREDSEFWKYCKYDLKKTDKVKHVLELSKYRSPSSWDFDLYHGSATWGVWCWTIYGLDIVSKEAVENTLNNYALMPYAKETYDKIDYTNKLRSTSIMKNKDFLYELKKKRIT
jgi:flavin-dependent dehydrogenase